MCGGQDAGRDRVAPRGFPFDDLYRVQRCQTLGLRLKNWHPLTDHAMVFLVDYNVQRHLYLYMSISLHVGVQVHV